MKNTIIIILVAIISLTAGVLWRAQNQYDFSTLDGSSYQFEQLEGKWVVINYFAEWCAPCLREIPELNKFQAYALANDNARLFAISYDSKTEQELIALRAKYDMQFPLITELVSALPFERPKYLPATFLIRPDGSFAGQLLGEQHADTLIEAIQP